MKYFISLLFSIAILNGFSANPLWQNISSKQVQVAGERKIIPQKGAVLKLNDAVFRSLQQSIPAEQIGRHIIVSLPLPDGSVADFRVFERTCMEQGLADRYPMIKTYQAISVENPFVTAKLDYTPFGFHAMVFSNEGVYFIDPYTNLNTGYYNCYYKKDYVRTNMEYSVCGTKTATDIDENNPTSANRQIGTNPGATDVVLDSKIRTFRLALACTIEYAAAVGGPSPTKATVLAAMVTSLNRVNGVYEKELSIHMNLVPKNDTLIFITSDSYTNNNGFTMLGQNTTVLNARIGSANYDIGHVFSTGGGGVAGLGVVCSVDKAEGVTGLPNPVGDSYDIDYVAHEMGHQYGGNHTFNGNTGSCSGNRNSSTAYEVGSGTTIMAYAGICTGNNPQQNSDAYFHRVSLQEIFNYISTTSCAVESTHSATPTVTEFTNTYNIPYKTSFEISAFATSGNSNPISYCWEEYDLGPAGNWNATNNTAAPIFRSFNPTESNTRVFPRWDSLINNNIKYLGEILPETTRNVKFRCTVRGIDNNGYGVFNAPENQLMIKSVTTTTLFRVNSQATATTITGNTNQTITWDVAGTTAAPISCANVNIYLSLDSARTFPYLLASNTPNDGSESVLIPNVATNNASARIKVKGSGNVFFDLNDGWIRINQTVAANFTVNNTAVCEGSSVTFTNASFGSPDSVRWTINGGSPVTSNSSTTISSIFNTPGSYSVSLTVYKAGVASTPYTTNITVNPKKVTDIVRVICEGESVTMGTEVFTANGDYTTHLQTSAGCDSTVNLALTVNPKKVTDIVRVICEGESVTVGTEVFTTNGNYTTHLQTSKGCDSTVNLALTVNPKKVTDIVRVICEGESVTVGTEVFTANGNYTTHLQTSAGCDSTVNLALTVNPKKVTDIVRVICEGESVTVGTEVFTANGNYTTHLQTSAGCDSTVNLALTVNPKKVTDIVRVICEGESVTVGTDVFTANGNYTTHLQTSKGCDSTVNLALTVNPKKVTDISRIICEGESVTVGTEVFTTNGNFTTYLQTSAGCDSTVNLALTVNPKKVTDIVRVICEGESVTVGTEVFTTNGNFTTHLQTSAGCDSTVNLALTVNPKKVTDIVRVICEGESVTVGTEVFTANGDYTTHLQTSAGCDSTVNLALTVNPQKVTDISRIICEGESVTVGTDIFTANGNYTTHLQTSAGCDSTVNLALTVNPKKVTDISRIICEGQSVTVGTDIFTANGNYTTHLQTSAGCDSTVNLALTVNQVSSTPAITQSNDTLYSNVIIAGASYYWYKAAVLVATTTVPYYKFASQGTYTLKITNSDCESPLSASFNTVSTGIKNNKLDVVFSVVPNPNNGQFVLNITAAKNETYQILMYNVAGQEIRKEEMSLQRGVNVKQFQLDAIEKGMYFISLIGKDGVITQNIIVQ